MGPAMVPALTGKVNKYSVFVPQDSAWEKLASSWNTTFNAMLRSEKLIEELKRVRLLPLLLSLHLPRRCSLHKQHHVMAALVQIVRYNIEGPMKWDFEVFDDDYYIKFLPASSVTIVLENLLGYYVAVSQRKLGQCCAVNPKRTGASHPFPLQGSARGSNHLPQPASCTHEDSVLRGVSVGSWLTPQAVS
jgi:hypothetical protein